MKPNPYEVDDEDELEVPNLDSKGNHIRPRLVYEDTPPTETQPTQVAAVLGTADMPMWQRRVLPQCVEQRHKTRQLVCDIISDATNTESQEKLLAEHVLSWIEGMRDTPVSDSLRADPEGAAIIKDEYTKLKLGTRLEAALTERKRKKRADSVAGRKRVEGDWAKALDAPAVEYKDTGETVAEWAKLSDRTSFEDRLEMRARVNAEYAVVRRGGKTRILHHTKDTTDYLSVEDFNLALAPFGFNHMGKPTPASRDWLNWKHRTEYSGVGFYPGWPLDKARVPDGHFNLWRGFSIEAKAGDWGRMKSHLLDIICRGNKVHFEWFMDWLADIFQNPQHKQGTCVAIKGREGAGKSILKYALHKILGSALHSVSQSKHIVGNFNSHLAHNLLLACEEAFWSGDKSAAGVLKDLVTEGTITIEAKGIDAISAPSYSRLLMLTNEDWCIPAGANSRRYFMLEASPKHANVRKYFKPLFDEIDNGGAEAMLHELLHRKITSNLRFAPETAALLKQREQSLSNLDRWVLEAAKSGAFTKHDGRCLLLKDKVAVTFSANDIRDAAKHYCGNDLGFNRTLGPLLLDLGAVFTRPREENKQVPSYTFPVASEFRANVKTRLNIDVDADEAPSIEGDESEFIRKATPPGNQREGVRMIH